MENMTTVTIYCRDQDMVCRITSYSAELEIGVFALSLLSLFWSLIKTFYPLIILAAIPMAIHFLWSYIQYKGSHYGSASGVGFWKTILDKGAYGEFLTYSILESIPGGKRLLVNVYVPKGDGTTTEVDVVMINEAGIFAFESKNYSGWIFGDEKNKMWTQRFRNGMKNSFYNPIWQNRGHIAAMQKTLPDVDEGLFLSYIIFSQRCELKKVKVSTPGVRVLKRPSLKKALRDDMRMYGARLDSHSIERISAVLGQYSHADEQVKEEHVQSIKRKQGLRWRKSTDPVTPVVEPRPESVPLAECAATIAPDDLEKMGKS